MDSYPDPEFERVVGWEPRGEVWVQVWKGDDISDRFLLASELVTDIAQACAGVIELDLHLAPTSGSRKTEMYAYVAADVFRDMMLEPDFVWRMC